MIKKYLLLTFGIFLALLLFLNTASAQTVCHGVRVCENYYECGVSDGVCPEDFDGCDKCYVEDPDCPEDPPIRNGVSAPGVGRRPSYVCEEDISVFTILKLNANQIYSFFEAFDSRFCTDLHFYEIMLTKNVEESKITIQLIEEMKTIPPEGFVYDYYNVSATRFTNDDIGYIDFLYRLPKSWADEHGVYEHKVHLYRRDRVFWTELTSEVFMYDDEYYYLRAEGDIMAPHAIIGQGVDIWDVIETIGFYYDGEIEFLDVLNYIDRYYTAQERLF